MTQRNGYAVPVAFSVLLHAIVLYVTFAGWSATPRLPDRPKVPTQVVQATLIEMKPRAPQVVPPEPEQKAPPPPPPPRESEREKQLEKERAEAERRKKAVEEQRRVERRRQEAEKKKKEEEQRRKEAEERRREEARKRAAEEEQQRKREQERLQEEKRERVQEFLREQARRQEVERQQAQEALIAVQSYQSAIQQHVARFWSRPPSARNDMQVTLQIQLVPGGDVIDVVVIESSGNGAFDRSAVNAVQKAGRLPVPDDPRLFDKSFRRFKMRFRPEDLNW